MVAGAEQTYAERVLSYGPIAYWPLWDTAGVIATELVNSPAQDGTYLNAPLLGQPGIGDGNTSVWFNVGNDCVDIYSVAFDGVFNGQEGSCMIWLKVNGAAVWTDGTLRRTLCLHVDANNWAIMNKDSVNNQLLFNYKSGGVSKNRTHAITSTDWIHTAMTWSLTANELKCYVNGVQAGATINGLGAWAGPLNPVKTLIASFSFAGANPFHGWLAHGVVFGSALPQPIIADLATV